MRSMVGCNCFFPPFDGVDGDHFGGSVRSHTLGLFSQQQQQHGLAENHVSHQSHVVAALVVAQPHLALGRAKE